MECAICMSSVAGYRLKGCTHSICRECATRMGEDEKNQYEPFGEFIGLAFTIPCLECPFCRAKEPITYKLRTWLNRFFQEPYRIWFETELFRGDDGTLYYTSRRKSNVQVIPNVNGFWSMMDRIPRSPRSTACYLGESNLFDDPQYVWFFDPPKHTYPHARTV